MLAVGVRELKYVFLVFENFDLQVCDLKSAVQNLYFLMNAFNLSAFLLFARCSAVVYELLRILAGNQQNKGNIQQLPSHH